MIAIPSIPLISLALPVPLPNINYVILNFIICFNNDSCKGKLFYLSLQLCLFFFLFNILSAVEFFECTLLHSGTYFLS